MSIPSMVKRSEKTFILFRFEAKPKSFISETKRNKALLISLWSEAKNSKRKKIFFSRERAKRMRNGSRFASFRFEAKNFFLQNRRTLDRIHVAVLVSAITNLTRAFVKTIFLNKFCTVE
jgi:hypothetical protein